ncbi:arginine--tRNA ligase, partial [candidate division WWE3 bacterium CG_4_9_14_3_um_filter_34_6]
MINVDDELKLLFVNVLKGLNLRSDIEFTIEHPADPVNGDYAVNVAMILFADSQINYRELTKPKAGTAHAVCCNARIIKALYKSPRMLADAIVAELSKNLPKYMKKIEVAGPGFINIYLTGQFFIDSVVELGSGNISFVPKDYSSKNISLEHTQINPNKEPHIGHLRNASIGDSLTKILRATGDNVKVQYYQNDIGQQIASIILAYKKQFIPYSGSFIDGSKKLLEWASMAYVDIESRYETDSDLKAEKEAIHIQIAMSGSEISKLAREITDGILKATLEIFGSLDIEYDLIVRESDILKNKLWEDTFKLLKKNDKFYLAKDGDKKGCWLVNMPDDEDKVIVRSNGIPTYAGNDIAYHLWKFGVLKDFKYLKLDWDTQSGPLYVTSTDESGSVMNEFSSADEIVNIIDISQTYPQNSVKQALNVLGYSDLAKHYKHVNYGFVFLSIASADELGIEHSKLDKVIKMSGRKGSVISINEFIDLLRTKLELEHGGFDSIDDVI